MSGSQSLPERDQAQSQPMGEAIAPQSDFSLRAYRYSLPPQLIAQRPAVPRDSARLLVVQSPVEHCHSYFRDLDTFLNPGDLLILNNTRVIPARLHGYKPSGAKVEVLLLEPRGQHRWLALVKPGRRLPPGSVIQFGRSLAQPDLIAQVEETDPQTHGRLLQFQLAAGSSSLTVEAGLAALGEVPLPPYITAADTAPEQYQTVYATAPGAVAAPTAGLHFTDQVFDRLAARNIRTATVTLHVGIGTFRPVETENITAHQMHAERVELPAATVEQIQQTKAAGGRVIAVGTTTVRTLEGVATQQGQIVPYTGPVNLFIYPGYEWKVVDGLITNFHLPESSLLMLVSALIGRDRLMALYDSAIRAQYRFYSFGDAMLILPTAVQGTP